MMSKKLLLINIDERAGEHAALALKTMLESKASLRNYDIVVTPIVRGILTNCPDIVTLTSLTEKEASDLIEGNIKCQIEGTDLLTSIKGREI